MPSLRYNAKLFSLILLAILLGLGAIWITRYSKASAAASSPPAAKLSLPAPHLLTITESRTPLLTLGTTTDSVCVPWQIVTSPNPSQRDNVLSGITVVTHNDIWAVGEYSNDNDYAQTLTEHWDGVQWNYIPSPSPGQRNYLTGVTAISPDDVWAVGFYQPANLSERTLTLHWNGTVWGIIPSPNPELGGATLYSVTALSSVDVWAVGKYPNAMGIVVTLIIHWNGTQWNVVPSPSPGDGISELRSISAVSADDIWAVGTYTISTIYHSLMLHWNGTQWSLVPSPDPGPESSEHFVEAVAAISTNDVWAVGSRNPNASTLTLHWDGTAWSKVPSPSPHLQVNYLTAVSGTASNNVWAVGWYGGASMTLHWGGSQWDLVPSSNYSQAANDLYGVASISPNEAWAVGLCQGCLGSGGSYRTLTEHYSSPCVTATATSIATVTAISTAIPTSTLIATQTVETQTTITTATILVTTTPTRTSVTVPTSTATETYTVAATASPTACAIIFTDVPPNSTFYPFIRCLACRGIISGYNDGTFRPGNDITRGQIAKMVSNAAGFSEDPGPQIYEDVDANNIFHQWINRLSNRGFMGGYPCGSMPEEPCNPPDNRPYFRPSSNATRAQLAKIVSNAAGFTDTPPSQIFKDVPPDNSFYLWVQRLASRGIIGGYPCGGEGEPCDSQNRPYFRPFNNVTRGQTAKIVAATFFPTCQPER